MPRSEHLGDGAYITETDDGDFILTANHHKPEEATDVVWIESAGMDRLLEFIKQGKKKNEE